MRAVEMGEWGLGGARENLTLNKIHKAKSDGFGLQWNNSNQKQQHQLKQSNAEMQRAARASLIANTNTKKKKYT